MKPLKTKVSVTIDSDTLAELRQLADLDDRSLSAYVNRVLRRHVKQVSSKKKILYTIEDDE